MVRKGIDCSSPPKGGAVALRAAGYSFICRYVSPQSWKRLTRSEIANYTAHGFDLVLNFESAAGNAKGGFKQGVIDAHSFLSQAKALGLNTSGITGYFSVDYDVPPSGMLTVINYLKGVASVLGYEHTGVYGSYYVVKAAAAAKAAKWLWETYAWSHGNSLDGRHIRQYSNGHSVLGADSDYDDAYFDAIGQYGSHSIPGPTPTPGSDDLTPQEAKNLADALYQGTQVPSVNGGARVANTTAHSALIVHVAGLEAAVHALQVAAATQVPLTPEQLSSIMEQAKAVATIQVAAALTEAAAAIHPTT